MTEDQLHDALRKLLPAMFETLVLKLKVPVEYLSGTSAPQATRAAEVLRWAEQSGRLGDLSRVLAEVRGAPVFGSRTTATSQVDGEAPRVSIGRLPATGKVLFGREEELAWLDDCWEGGVRVAAVVAFGGVGKSALVNAWIARLDAAGWRGARRVYGWSFYSQGTDRLSSSDEFVDAALRWFGDPEPERGSPWDKGERLAELVRRARTLLVLDGLEPLQWGPGVQTGSLKDAALQALVKELGAQNKGLCLITSRIGVADLEGVGGDKVRSKDLNSLSPEAGAELLRARGAKGTDEELREAAREYKGHGLALTLLGSYLADVAKGDIRRRKEIGPVEADEIGEPARRVMAAYERWLGKADVAILHMLGLFDRPVEEEEIAALRKPPNIPGLTSDLCIERERKWYHIFASPPTRPLTEQEWNRAVSKLRKAGLLLVEQDERLDAHPLVREHFGEQLRRKHVEAWREGHRRLYEHLREKAKELPETIEEMAPLYAAVVHGCLAGQAHSALEVVYQRRIQQGDAFFSTKILGAVGSLLTTLSAFYDEPWKQISPSLPLADRLYVMLETSFALQGVGRFSEAIPVIKEARKICKTSDMKTASRLAGNLANLELLHGNVEQAVALAIESVKLAEQSGDVFRSVANMSVFGDALMKGDHMVLSEKAFQTAEASGGLLLSLQGFRYALLLLEQGRHAEVLERATQAMETAKRNNWLLDIALAHLSLGHALLLAAQQGAVGGISHSITHLDHAVDGFRRAGRQDYLPVGLLARAALHLHNGDFGAAKRDLDEALSLATRCEFRLHEADAHLGLARLSLAEANPTAAREHLADAGRIIADTGYHRRDEELAELEAKAKQESTARARGAQGVGESSIKTPLPLAPVAPLAVNSGSAPSLSTPAPSIAMPNLPAFPQPVLDAYRDRKLAILFGSGLSLAKDVGGGFPRWDELPGRLLDLAEKQRLWTQNQIDSKRAFFKDYLGLEGMLRELDTIKDALGGQGGYRAALASLFRPAGAAPGDVHRALAALGVDAVLTTNYDRLFEAADPLRIAYTWQKAGPALADIQDGRAVLFKIHGSAEDDTSVVMTRAEYDAAAANEPYRETMKLLLQTHTFLLVGYGINDPLDLDVVFGLNKRAFGSASRRHYALMPKSVSPNDLARWDREMNIQVIPYDDHGDLPAILRELGKTPRNPP